MSLPALEVTRGGGFIQAGGDGSAIEDEWSGGRLSRVEGATPQC